MIKQKGMLYDVTLCIGCGSCYNACKEQNKLSVTNKDYLKDHLFDKTLLSLRRTCD
jgi:Fe-S-cluster-containing dehydrogenase component